MWLYGNATEDGAFFPPMDMHIAKNQCTKTAFFTSGLPFIVLIVLFNDARRFPMASSRRTLIKQTVALATFRQRAAHTTVAGESNDPPGYGELGTLFAIGYIRASSRRRQKKRAEVLRISVKAGGRSTIS